MNGNCTAPNNCSCNPGYYGAICNQEQCGDGIRVPPEICDSSIGCDNTCHCISPIFTAANGGGCVLSSTIHQQVYSYTGSIQLLNLSGAVPGTSIGIFVYGAGGGSASRSGGAGGFSYGIINATEGNALSIYVGGTSSGSSGGWGLSNGGNGGGGVNGWNGAGGGGSSGIILDTYPTFPFIIAGGGGGGGSGN